MESVPVELASASEDLTIVYLFMRADIVVKAVMAILAFMSVWSWAIAIEKALQMRGVHARARQFEHEFWSGAKLEELAERYGRSRNNPFGRVLAAALRDWDPFAVNKSAGAEAN